jgi:uncharacterized protein (TIGR00730 family)
MISRKTVTVFGSSLPVMGEDEFETAYKLGALLGSSGFNVCSGGYRGIMEAVSKGVTENGGEATGITLSYISSPPNNYLTRVIICDSLFARIEKLISSGDAFIVLQGGTGTLLELAAVWEYVNKDIIPVKPVACHSIMWKQIGVIIDNQISKEKRVSGIVKYFDNIEEIVGYLSSALK